MVTIININITIDSKKDVGDIAIVDSPSRQSLEVSEQLRNIRAKHHSKYMENKSKNTNHNQKSRDPPKDGTPVTQKDNNLNDGPKGTVCIAGDSILNGINEPQLSQKRPVKFRQLRGT